MTTTVGSSSDVGMTNSALLWPNEAMRVAVAVSPPLLAELLSRLFDGAGMEVIDARPCAVDVALVDAPDESELDAEVTITLNQSATAASIVDQWGRRSSMTISDPTAIIEYVRSIDDRWPDRQ